MKRSLLVLFTALSGLALAESPKESDYYPITPLPVPDGVVLEVSGIEVLPDQKIAVASRRGDIYTLTGAYDTDPGKVQYQLFAEGIHESLGLSYKDGWLYATQRPEVSRLRDTDGDGRADVFETLSDGWGICGDYHEYAFGSRHDKDGNIWVVLCLTGSGGTRADYRGWCVRVTPDGKVIPTTSGIRSPGGIGANHLGDMFYCDNQGPWNGSSSLKHLKIGSFQGNPTGNVHYQLTDAIGPRPEDPKSGSRIVEEAERIPEYVPPTCILPHGSMGNSPAGIACDQTDGKFGPFKKQLFIAEQTASQVQRVSLEQVNGVYQGACFPFLSGFKSGNVAIRFGEDGILFNGGTSRGWGSRGGSNFALERVNWTGEVPFEMLHVSAKPDGFEITFTQPADVATLKDLASYNAKAYTYIYQSNYGSPVVDKLTPTVTKATPNSDGLSVRITLDQLTKGHVHELLLPGVKSAKGFPLLHPVAYYTLNQIPGD
ncbi:hypothetical protein N8564_03665 [Verrucomicrobiales bacterium]|nr:hypothetical protein [Verrucomicrobiales bacterium]